jgi:large subunit ribosomal protein L25
MLKLNVQKRKKSGSKQARALLKTDYLPSVLYGRGIEPSSIAVRKDEFHKVWKEAGESTMITLDGLDAQASVLIRDVDIDPVADTPRHVDFYAVAKGQKVRVWVPVEFEGESPAVKQMGGTLVKVIHELEVEAEPQNLPHELSVDISGLTDFDSQLTVADIRLPAGVEALAEDTDVVGLVTESKEEDLETAPEMNLENIEVEKKGKVDGEESGEHEKDGN